MTCKAKWITFGPVHLSNIFTTHRSFWKILLCCLNNDQRRVMKNILSYNDSIDLSYNDSIDCDLCRFLCYNATIYSFVCDKIRRQKRQYSFLFYSRYFLHVITFYEHVHLLIIACYQSLIFFYLFGKY
jgi:hypothetical protein